MRINDFTYSEGCGCQVTFFAESDYHTSRMTPGIECKDHTGRYQVAERDCLVERAKAELGDYRNRTGNFAMFKRKESQ